MISVAAKKWKPAYHVRCEPSRRPIVFGWGSLRSRLFRLVFLHATFVVPEIRDDTHAYKLETIPLARPGFEIGPSERARPLTFAPWHCTTPTVCNDRTRTLLTC